MQRNRWIRRLAPCILLLAACAGGGGPETVDSSSADAVDLGKYTSFRLSADLDALTADQRAMVRLLIEASVPMDDLFWKQAYGDRRSLLDSIDDPDVRRFAEINYGPWDRLDDNRPFVAGVDAKSPGANFYPAGMTVEEFEAAAEGSPELRGQYSLVRRDESGALRAVPYSEAFREELALASAKLREASALARDPGLRRYLELRADALLADDYRASDLAWMDMKDNPIDVVIGPIENYEDQLFGYRTSFEAYVLIKDLEWSARLARYAALLPELQRGLPVPEAYRSEVPGTDADLNAYDVVYYAGDCNAGSKTIAINLPNDEEVQLSRGTRRLQLKNAMRAKFDKILVPIADELIDADQRRHVTFDAFFANTMFHEVAHGLGIKNRVDGGGSVRESLLEQASALEEGKADVLGLYMVTRLLESGELEGGDLQDYYTTFLAGIFRSVRFGASSAHGRANMVRFNFFREMGAFERNESTGTYRANMERMREAIDALSEKILRLQGDGDYDGAVRLTEESGIVGPGLRADLDRLSSAGIPVDIVFEQGIETLGL